MSYTMFKIITSEIVIAEIEYENDTHYCLKNPITFEISESEGFIMKSWLAFTLDDWCLLDKTHVISVLGTTHEVMTSTLKIYLNRQQKLKDEILLNHEKIIYDSDEEAISFEEQLSKTLNDID